MYIICEETENGVRVFDTKDGINEAITHKQLAYLKAHHVRFKRNDAYNFGHALYRYLVAQVLWNNIKTFAQGSSVILNRADSVEEFSTDYEISKHVLESVKQMMELNVKTFQRDWIDIYESAYNVIFFEGAQSFIIPMYMQGLMFVIEQGIFFVEFPYKLLRRVSLETRRVFPEAYLYIDNGSNVAIKVQSWVTGWDFYGKLLYEGYVHED